MAGDPFSEMLRLTKARSYVYGGLKAAGRWAIHFPAMDKMKFFAVVKGSSWLSYGEDKEPVRCEAGDVFLLSSKCAFVIGSDLEATPIEAEQLFPGNSNHIVQLGTGEECFQIGGSVRLDPTNGELLRDVLPPLIYVPSSSQHAAVLQWLLDRLVQERAADLPGTTAASEQIAQLMFVEILRAYVESAGSLEAGWLRALSDKRIAPALQLMHNEPARNWKLEELAKACAMSRTTFAVYFKAVAGLSPLTYLTEWRMRLAKETLQEENVSVTELAQSLGYTSEHAFSTAFKRVVGSAPKRYQKAGSGANNQRSASRQ